MVNESPVPARRSRIAVGFQLLVNVKQPMHPQQLLPLFSDACFAFCDESPLVSGYRVTVHGTGGELSSRFLVLALLQLEEAGATAGSSSTTAISATEFLRCVVEERVQMETANLENVICVSTDGLAAGMLQTTSSAATMLPFLRPQMAVITCN